MLVDSCIDSSTGNPAALDYLATIGIAPATSIDLVVATHWHDDHVRGLRAVLEASELATFSCSAALGEQEFLSMVDAYEKRPLTKATSGVREINEVLKIVVARGGVVRPSLSDRLLYRLPAENSGHGNLVEVHALSPSDSEYRRFMKSIGSLVPIAGQPKTRCQSIAPNDSAVVIWIQIGNRSVVLGSDLEETGVNGVGWSAIVSSTTRPGGRADVYKVAHHGSRSGHHPQVWTQLLTADAFAILTPWNKNIGLPTSDDVNRLNGLTPNAYITAQHSRMIAAARRDPVVEKTLRDHKIKIRSIKQPMGMIQLRNPIASQSPGWQVSLRGTATHL